MKIPALAFAAALLVTGSAFAAQDHDTGASSSSNATAHQLASNFTGALHKIGAATRHALQRADASLHRLGKHDSEHGNG